MARFEVPPADAPPWFLLALDVLHANAILGWLVAYISMAAALRRAPPFYAAPLLSTGLDLAWEAAHTGFAAADGDWLQAGALAAWLVADVRLARAMVASAPRVWGTSGSSGGAAAAAAAPQTARVRRFRRFMARHQGAVLVALVLAGLPVHVGARLWWTAVPGRGTGDKTGKFWRGREGYDIGELFFWTALAAQVVLSIDTLRLLRARQHARGANYLIYLSRIHGSLSGLVAAPLLQWWFWPAAHGYVFSPLAVAGNVTWITCDALYGLTLFRLRAQERSNDKQRQRSPSPSPPTILPPADSIQDKPSVVRRRAPR